MYWSLLRYERWRRAPSLGFVGHSKIEEEDKEDDEEEDVTSWRRLRDDVGAQKKKAEALQKWRDYLNEIKLGCIFNRDVVVEAV